MKRNYTRQGNISRRRRPGRKGSRLPLWIAFCAILAAADETVVLHETYRRGCMRERNAKMVQDADLCIAYVRRRPSGSAQTMQMAEKKGIPVFRL